MSDARTPYQRGNRDGLRALATMLEAEAQRELDGQERLCSTGDAVCRPGAQHAGAWLLHTSTGRVMAYRTAAARARRMAEALPDDPEVPVAPQAAG